MGALTDFLLERGDLEVEVMEIDRESIAYLKNNKPELEGKIHEADFLKFDLAEFTKG